MIINFIDFIKESIDSDNIKVIPMDIRKKFDNGFKNGKYKGKDINFIYDYISDRITGINPPKRIGWRDTLNFFDRNEEYLDHMSSLLMGKRVGYYNCGDKVKDNYHHVIPVVRRVEFNSYGMLIVSGGGGFFGENPGIGAHFGGAIDERMPLEIIKPKIIITSEDPYGEEDWDS